MAMRKSSAKSSGSFWSNFFLSEPTKTKTKSEMIKKRKIFADPACKTTVLIVWSYYYFCRYNSFVHSESKR